MAKNKKPATIARPSGPLWAIRHESLDSIKAALRKAYSGEVKVMAPFEESEEALSFAGVDVQEGIATINITGVISRYDDFWAWLFGGDSTERIDEALTAALESPQVRGILLQVNSPGGEATGISELAGRIRAASKAKPVVAYVEGDADSAAYWLASAAPLVVINKTAWAGSIGAYYLFTDDSKAMEAEGIKEIRVVSSQSPNKVPDPSTKEGKEKYQAQVDALAQVFIEDIAANRGTTVENVMSNFGQGDVFMGADAVAHGLADEVGTLETAIAELGRKINSAGGIRAMKPEEIKAQYPDAAAALVAEGATAERARIQSIDAIDAPEDREVINAAKYDGKSSAADVALKVLEAQKVRRAKAQSARAEDAESVNEAAAAGAGEQADKGEGENPLMAAGKNRGRIKDGR